MSSSPSVKIVLGTHTIGDSTKDPIAAFDAPQDVQSLLDAFHARGYRHADSSRDYSPHALGSTEERLGLAGAASRFIIDTKVHSGTPGDHEPAKVALSIDDSLAALRTDAVNIMYLHVPDRQTPFEQTAAAMDAAHKQGKFKAFGLSNYTAAEVQRFIDICKQQGYVMPSAFQGHYNAIVRGGEEELFPLLRRHNMAFYAYSPAAGGFFSDTTAASSRWAGTNDVAVLYNKLYGQPCVQASAATVREAARKHDISGHAAAIRWTTYHSALDGRYGDGVVFGVTKLEQLHKTLDAIEQGPLPGEVADAISAVYATVKGNEPPYHL